MTLISLGGDGVGVRLVHGLGSLLVVVVVVGGMEILMVGVCEFGA